MRARRQKKARRIFFGLFVFLFAAVCGFKAYQLRQESRHIDEQMAELNQLLEEEKEKQLDAYSKASYCNTDEYKAEVARTQFNLIFEGESLIVIDYH